MARQRMTRGYLVKDNILYRVYEPDKWGTHPRYYINFDLLVQYRHREMHIRKVDKLIDKEGKLYTSENKAFPDHIQEIYKEWMEAEVERLLTGDA